MFLLVFLLGTIAVTTLFMGIWIRRGRVPLWLQTAMLFWILGMFAVEGIMADRALRQRDYLSAAAWIMFIWGGSMMMRSPKERR